jgi:hypothetical protein
LLLFAKSKIRWGDPLEVVTALKSPDRIALVGRLAVASHVPAAGLNAIVMLPPGHEATTLNG